MFRALILSLRRFHERYVNSLKLLLELQVLIKCFQESHFLLRNCWECCTWVSIHLECYTYRLFYLEVIYLWYQSIQVQNQYLQRCLIEKLLVKFMRSCYFWGNSYRENKVQLMFCYCLWWVQDQNWDSCYQHSKLPQKSLKNNHQSNLQIETLFHCL